MSTNYQKNRDKILTYQKKYYHQKIKKMTDDQLNDFRSKKSAYYKLWYHENREELTDRRCSREKDITDLGGYIIRKKRGRPKSDDYDPPRKYIKRNDNEVNKNKPFDNGNDKNTGFLFI
jgi:hypothetical protein